jgi:hypothetical protein
MNVPNACNVSIPFILTLISHSQPCPRATYCTFIRADRNVVLIMGLLSFLSVLKVKVRPITGPEGPSGGVDV